MSFLQQYNPAIASIGVALTAIGVFVAIIIYKLQVYSSRRQIVRAAKSQLEVIAPWASASREGYIGEPSDEDKFNRTNPFYVIYGIEHDAIKDVMILPGVLNFSEDFSRNLANFIQNIGRIRDLETFREKLVLANIATSFVLDKKIKESLGKDMTYPDFINNLSDEEKRLAKKLYKYNHEIHYQFIGSRNSGGLKQNYHDLMEEILQKESDLSILSILKRWAKGTAIVTLVVVLVILLFR